MERRADEPLTGTAKVIFVGCDTFGQVAMCSAVSPLMPGLAAVALGMQGSFPDNVRSGRPLLFPTMPHSLLIFASGFFFVFAVAMLIRIGGSAASFRNGELGHLAPFIRNQTAVAASTLFYLPFAPNPVFLIIFLVFSALMVPLVWLFRQPSSMDSEPARDPFVDEFAEPLRQD